MFGWRRRSEGFEWNEYVRTTILVRRAGRQRRLDDAQMAALAKVKDARDSAVEAGKAGIEDARNWLWALVWALTDAAWSLIKTASRAVSKAAAALFGRAAAALRSLPLPALPGLSSLTAALPRVQRRLPSFQISRLFRIENLVMASGLLLAVMIGVKALAPQQPEARVAHLTAADATGSEPAETASGEVTGRATAFAGDTLRVAGTLVRLKGIEAPEARQPCLKSNGRRWSCGLEAKDGLNRLVRGKTVTCSVSGAGVQGPPLASCATGDIDIAAEMVRIGLVFAETGLFRSFASEQDAAKAAKAGLWQGEAERPAEWRQRLWDEAKRQAPDGCPIKGYVRGSGRTYVLPWSNDYQSGKLRTVKGERWFCTEEEALAAGFKPSVRS